MSEEKLNLDGDGFSKEPLDPDELARHRHMRHHYERHFLETDDFIKKIGIGWIVSFSKAAPSLVQIVGGAAVLGGILAWLSEKGVF